MTGFDFVIAFVVLFGLWRGFQAGLVKSLLSLVSWFAALILAAKFAKMVAPWFASFVESQDLQLALGFLAVVLAVITVLSLLAKLLTGALKGLRLEFLDRFLGGIFGAAKGILLVLIFINLTASLLNNFNFFRQSVLAKSLLPYAPAVTKQAKDLLQQGMAEIVPDAVLTDDNDESADSISESSQKSTDTNSQINNQQNDQAVNRPIDNTNVPSFDHAGNSQSSIIGSNESRQIASATQNPAKEEWVVVNQ